jgi:hypothetical protein
MRMLGRRVLAVALSLTAAVGGGLLVAGRADAQQVTTGSLSFSGDSGSIGGTKVHTYSTSNGDALDVTSAGGATLNLRITGYNGDWYYLDLDAPGTPDRPVPGRSALLVPGTYADAHRYPFNGTGPGLSLYGDGSGCNTVTGSFTVTKSVFVGSYVQTFDATFEQHCEGGPAATRGEVHIANPPAPPGTATSPTRAATAGPNAATTRPFTGRSGNAVGNNVDAANPATPAVVRDAFRAPLLLMGAGLVAWVVIAALGFAVVLSVVAIRRR